jgi:pantoate--beta-alanine ligase
LTLILRTVAELRALVRGWKAAGELVGVVPTMGALHDGHLSLVRAAKAECERAIVTIFVNPLQFNNPDDLKKYPRTEAADAALLATVGVDVIFAPSLEEVYPDGFATTVTVTGVTQPLEGALRPGHFEGVATVVTKLFGMTMADRGYFGQKDWQQLQVVTRLVRDLNIPIWIVGCETIREADGLAMSSRNARLDGGARAKAPVLFAAMTRAVADIRAGGSDRMAIREAAEAVRAAGFERVEYIELRDAGTLMPSDDPSRPRRMLAAAWLGGVRLIDNIAV